MAKEQPSIAQLLEEVKELTAFLAEHTIGSSIIGDWEIFKKKELRCLQILKHFTDLFEGDPNGVGGDNLIKYLKISLEAEDETMVHHLLGNNIFRTLEEEGKSHDQNIETVINWFEDKSGDDKLGLQLVSIVKKNLLRIGRGMTKERGKFLMWLMCNRVGVVGPGTGYPLELEDTDEDNGNQFIPIRL